MLTLRQKIVSGTVELLMVIYAFMLILPTIPETFSRDVLLGLLLTLPLVLGSLVLGLHMESRIESILLVRLITFAGYAVVISSTLNSSESWIVVVGFIGYLCITSLWNGYSGSYRYNNEEQLYQKYDWISPKVYKLPLAPYYYIQSKKDTTTEDSSK